MLTARNNSGRVKQDMRAAQRAILGIARVRVPDPAPWSGFRCVKAERLTSYRLRLSFPSVVLVRAISPAPADALPASICTSALTLVRPPSDSTTVTRFLVPAYVELTSVCSDLAGRIFFFCSQCKRTSRHCPVKPASPKGVVPPPADGVSPITRQSLAVPYGTDYDQATSTFLSCETWTVCRTGRGHATHKQWPTP